MVNVPSFDSNRKFYGDIYFPYGIDRSGEFTRQQVNLLIDHGWSYQALAEGSKVPATPEEEAFIAVCRGERAAKTAHEKVWMLFCSKVNMPKVVVSSPFAARKLQKDSDFESLVDNDFKSSGI